MRFLVTAVLRQLLPPVCPLCHRFMETRAPDPFCRRCMAAIPFMPAACCPRCALPYLFSSTNDPHLCGRCLLTPPAYQTVFAPCLYEGNVREAVQRFKFNQRPNLDRPFSRLINRVVPADVEADLVVPVPLHPIRLRRRTYNQALLLARELGHLRRVPVAVHGLRKIVDTPAQQTLTASERKENLEKSFITGDDVSGKRILLVDDVMTTGATVDQCSRVLLAEKAASVTVAVIARAPL